MKKWNNVTWKSSLGMSVTPDCRSLELNDGFQQSFYECTVHQRQVGLLLEQELVLKRIKMNYGQLLS